MDTEKTGKTFVDSLSADMSKEDFLQAVRGVITDEDKKVLGAGYEDQVVQAILYPSVFAPYPATFDSNAVAGIVDDVGASDLQKTQDPTIDLEHTDTIIRRTQVILEKAIGLGVIEPNENGRFFIRPEVADKLKPILEKFEE